MSRDKQQPIRVAKFQPQVVNYWLLSGAIIFVVTVIGIVLLIPWLVIGRALGKMWLDRMSCELTPRTLEVRKGVLNRVESTIPLDKITDMLYFQGPIMRLMGLDGLRVETAGQSSGGAAGSLVQLIGIENARAFREAVLEQRDVQTAALTGAQIAGSGASASDDATEDGSDLRAIRASVERIEQLLTDRATRE